MNNRIAFILLVLLSFFTGNVFSESQKHDAIWTYEKVSEVDIFGGYDANVISNLRDIYSKVRINAGEKKLNIRNYFLEDSSVCSIDYVKVTQTTLSYFLSQETVNMYEKLFSREGIPLSEFLSMLESIFPERSCPPPYDELIKNDDRLIVLDQNYVIFFKEIKDPLKTDLVSSDKEVLATYCHNEKAEHAYDGNSIYICDFYGMNLKNTYNKIITLNTFSHKYMSGNLPMKNQEVKINGSTVSYEWNGFKFLNVSIAMYGQVIKYYFNEKSSGTRVEITGSTQY